MTETLKPKQKDREGTESKLLEAAKDVFSQHGFNGATTRMISLKAGVNLSLINRYFKGKYGLLLSLVHKQNKTFREVSFNYPAQSNVTDEICLYSDHVFKEFFEDPQFVKIVMGQFFSDEEFLREFRSIISPDQAHPQLEERLQLFIKGPTKEIAVEIETAIFGIGILNILVSGLSAEEAKKSIRSFLTRYAKSL